MTKDRVIFRTYLPKHERGTSPEVVALLIDQQEQPGVISSYLHIGQHGSADYRHVLTLTRPSTPDEYADLKRELEDIGYDLAVCKRWNGR